VAEGSSRRDGAGGRLSRPSAVASAAAALLLVRVLQVVCRRPRPRATLCVLPPDADAHEAPLVRS
jgi:hypothetical protein